jgi:hypothetical protein
MHMSNPLPQPKPRIGLTVLVALAAATIGFLAAAVLQAIVH